MKKVLKLIWYNLLVLLALLMIVEFISMIYLDGTHLFHTDDKVMKQAWDKRANLPNYNGVKWARTFFYEHSKMRTEYRSFIGWKKLPFKGKTINIDDQGIRKSIQAKSPIDSLPVAVFLGGSTMWGIGTDDANTIPSIFARKSGWNYKALNYGETGYCAYQGFQILQLNIRKGLQPALVITYDGVNNSPATLRPYFAHVREGQMINALRGADQEPEYSTHFMKATRDLIIEIKKKYGPSEKTTRAKPLEFTKERNREAATELLESWMATRQACLETGADFICILQPNPFIGNPDTKNLNLLARNPRYKNGATYYNDVLDLMNDEKYIILKDHFIDMIHALDSVPNVYIDFCHLSPKGNKIIVDVLIHAMKTKQLTFSENKKILLEE